jgi:hypothetical protein
MFTKTQQILEGFINAEVVDGSNHMNRVLKQANTNTYVYVMIADNKIAVLGEGTGGRGYLIFPGRCAPAHLKAITAALATHTSKKIERVVIPTKSKEESLVIEKELFNTFNFHETSVDEKNKKLYEKRLLQIGRKDMKSTAMLFLMNATGTDMGTFKKIRSLISKKENEFISAVFGGYYIDI